MAKRRSNRRRNARRNGPRGGPNRTIMTMCQRVYTTGTQYLNFSSFSYANLTGGDFTANSRQVLIKRVTVSARAYTSDHPLSVQLYQYDKATAQSIPMTGIKQPTQQRPVTLSTSYRPWMTEWNLTNDSGTALLVGVYSPDAAAVSVLLTIRTTWLTPNDQPSLV